MIRNKWRTIFSAILLASVSALAACNFEQNESEPAPVVQDKRELALMTSLPLVWGDAQDIETVIAGEGDPHPFYTHLQRSYTVTPVDSLTADGVLSPGHPDILLLAQNRPLAPEELVALDDWIRAGGRAVIMADPLLAMESGYPIGDKRRPQGVSLMSPLFNRWGLDFIFDEENAGPVRIEGGNYDVRAFAVGGFAMRPEQDLNIAACTISELPMLARCQVGKGRATLIADADMLGSELLAQSDNAKFVTALIEEVQRD